MEVKFGTPSVSKLNTGRLALRAMLPVKIQRFWPPRRRVKSEPHK